MAEFAGIYRALNAQGVKPWEADGLELWQVGALLGVDLPAQEDPADTRRARLREIKAKAVERGLMPA